MVEIKHNGHHFQLILDGEVYAEYRTISEIRQVAEKIAKYMNCDINFAV